MSNPYTASDPESGAIISNQFQFDMMEVLFNANIISCSTFARVCGFNYEEELKQMKLDDKMENS